jgi:hypothetical protein
MPTTVATDPRKVIPMLPPLNWRKEVPLYRISADTHPAPKERVKFEPPFSRSDAADHWQYGDRLYRAGEVIATTEWPNPGTMIPLNYAAQQVMEFFKTRQKSRMQRAPWRDGQVFLDDGLSNPLPKIGLPKLPSVEMAASASR